MTILTSFLLESAGLAGLGLAAVNDLRSRVIPNTLVLWVLGAGGAARLAQDGPAAWPGLAVALFVFLPLAALAYAGVVGGGDAKLIPAASLLVEPPAVPALLLAIAVAGAVMALTCLVVDRARRVVAVAQSAPWISPPAISRVDLPYGLAIAAGVAFSLLPSA